MTGSCSPSHQHNPSYLYRGAGDQQCQDKRAKEQLSEGATILTTHVNPIYAGSKREIHCFLYHATGLSHAALTRIFPACLLSITVLNASHHNCFRRGCPICLEKPGYSMHDTGSRQLLSSESADGGSTRLSKRSSCCTPVLSAISVIARNMAVQGYLQGVVSHVN